MADSTKLKKAISEILKDAEPKLKFRKVRQQLKKKLNIDLTNKKKEIDRVIMQVWEELHQESDEEEQEYWEKKIWKYAGGGESSGYTTKTFKLSPELSSVMGTSEMARDEVVKKIWSIIKEKNLYDPKNNQFAICNEELLPVFGVKRFRTSGMMKHLASHLIY